MLVGSLEEEKKPVAVAYCRASTPMQQEVGKSLDDQLDEIREHCKEKGYRLAGRDVYRDIITGARRDRAGYYQLLARVERADVDVIVAWDLKRAGRNTLDAAWLAAKCKEFDVRIELANGGRYVLDEPHDKLVYDILCAVAEFERAAILSTMMRGKKAGHRRGNWVNGAPPYGYRIVGQRGDKRLEPDPDERVWLVEAFRLYASGTGTRDIAHHFNDQGVPTRHGKPWNHMTIRRFFDQDVYLGWLSFQDNRVRGRHEAIVEEALWDRCQAVLEARRKKYPGRPPST